MQRRFFVVTRVGVYADEIRQRFSYRHITIGRSMSMSHLNPNQHFDVENWRDRQIAQRTKDALAARDAAFAEKHADTPLRELALYLARCARTLRHSPAPCEVDGGTFIEERFGSWDAALEMARLRPPAKEPKLKDTARYKREKAVQEPLFYEESERKKKAKRAKAAASHAAQQSRLEEKKRLEQEKKEARDAAARQREIEKAAKAAEQEVSC